MSNLQRRHSAIPAALEHGFITLGVSLGILVLSTLVVLNVSNAIQLEQKISNNEVRAKQAFEAAEAGLSAALSVLEEDPDADNDGAVGSDGSSSVTSAEYLFDVDANGTPETNTLTVGTGSVTVTATDTSSGELTTFLITSVGYSDDKSAMRTIRQRMVTINPLPNAPDNPFVTRGTVVITGSATVHNPEGQSTIWSGSEVDMGSNNATSTEVPDATAANYPACMDTPMTCSLVDASSRLLKGVDVIENDSSLGSLTGDDFFRNFFGTNADTYRASMVTVETNEDDFETDAHLATNEVIWVDGDASLGTVTVGCTTAVTGNNVCPSANRKPSIVIVDGNLTFQGTPHFYGIVFVTGNVTISGNTTIHGAIVVAGTATSSTGGSLDVWYNSDVLGGTAKAGATAGSAGTWKDF